VIGRAFTIAAGWLILGLAVTVAPLSIVHTLVEKGILQ